MDGDWQLEQRAEALRLRLRIPGGSVNVAIVPTGAIGSPVRATLVRAGKVLRGDGLAQPWDGWISHTYGRKTPALSLSVEVEAFDNCAFTTEFQLPA